MLDWLSPNEKDRRILVSVYQSYRDGVPVSTLSKAIGVNVKTLHRRLGENLDLLIVWMSDGMKWVKPRYRLGDLVGIVNLINEISKVQTDFQRFSSRRIQVSEIKGLAKKLICSVRSFKKGDKLQLRGRKSLDGEIVERLKLLFGEYLSSIDDKILVFENLSPKEGESRFMVRPYETRFNSSARMGKLWYDYDHAWSCASSLYDRGIFLTLTTDPSKFDSLDAEYRNISRAWNNFMSWLTRRLERREKEGLDISWSEFDALRKAKALSFRPGYIKNLEPTRSGLPHLHVVLFGLDRIASQQEISAYWNKYQGSIVYLYKIFKAKSGDWRWHKDRPQSTKFTVKKYLKKELSKLFSDPLSLAIYWATGKRFFTYSRSFNNISDGDVSDDPASESEDDVPKKVSKWHYLTSVTWGEFRELYGTAKDFLIYPKKPPPKDNLFLNIIHRFSKSGINRQEREDLCDC